ncbi:MAG: GAF domain-containing protein [Elusimicrobia bacterium]|nr:GAF domain-containing protein [Elusimicrobiota bacterium]MBK7207176.1 GAF domain-containing protein [Elusimicrobiota bacterium]MBK7545982.1 GAF domain-containing protein [Elusimicrobiota bacterium]MBK7574858.1 GAF domain-containing protein [Elusimicrobiota bacterium]MBK7687492.1 GAF domain-containing protein [Elusimicrobiota bacterium]
MSRAIYFETVKALERQAAGVQTLSRYARSSAKREQVLTDLLAKTLEIVGADAGAVLLADEGAGVFEFAAVQWAGLNPTEASAREKALKLFRLKLNDGIIGQVHQTQEPVALPDVSKNAVFRKDMAEAVKYEIKNLLAVPIQTEDARLGVLELFNKTPKGTFSASDMGIAVALGYQMALVLDIHRSRNAAIELATKASSPAPAPGPSAAPPPAVLPTAAIELQEARRIARDAQAQLQETRQLLDTALQVQEEATRRAAALSEELTRAKAMAEAATPAQQMTRLLRSVEPIAFTLSVDQILKNFAELVGRLVNAQATQIFLWDERAEQFTLAHSTVSSSLNKGLVVAFKKGEGLAGFAGERMELVHVDDVTRDDHFSKSIDEVPGVLTKAVLAGPLAANGRLVGVLEVINRRDGESFTGEDGVSLAGMALLGAAALEKALTHRALADSARLTLAAISDLVDARSPAENGRAERMRQGVLALGEALTMKDRELKDLEWAALLYNVGKIALPAELFTKRGELSAKDRELLQSVPVVSGQILGPIPALGGVAKIVRHVQERWDGAGSPDRLAGVEIPAGARILAVVDLLENLLAGGPGRKPLPLEVALDEVEVCAEKQLDPAMVETLLRLARAHRLRALGRPR